MAHVPGHFINQQNSGDRRPHNGGKKSRHPEDDEILRRDGNPGQPRQGSRQPAGDSAQDKKGKENSPGRAGAKAGDGKKEPRRQQKGQRPGGGLEGEPLQEKPVSIAIQEVADGKLEAPEDQENETTEEETHD